jgi:hypothetical protein
MEKKGDYEERKLLEEIVTYSSADIPHNLKLRMFDILDNLRNNFYVDNGYIIVLGYEPYMNWVNPMDEDIFKGRCYNLKDDDIVCKLYGMHNRGKCKKHINGAILIDKKANILHSGMYLKVDPEKVLEDMCVPNDSTLSERFGFKRKVGTKHIIGISASFRMPNTICYILSKESKEIMLFEKGKILYSPIHTEINEIYLPEPQREIEQTAINEPILRNNPSSVY